MKRSEAISRLLSYIERTTDLNGSLTAKGILDFVEEDLGLRPPYDASQDDGVDTMEWEEEKHEKSGAW